MFSESRDTGDSSDYAALFVQSSDLQQWRRSNASDIVIWTAQDLQQHLHDILAFERLDELTDLLSQLCPSHIINAEYSSLLLRVALNDSGLDLNQRRRHLILGIDRTRWKHLNASKHGASATIQLAHFVQQCVFGYLIWSPVASPVAQCDLNAVCLDLYWAKSSSDGTFEDVSTNPPTLRHFQGIQHRHKTCVVQFDKSMGVGHGSKSLPVVVHKKKMQRVQRRIRGVGDLLLCLWLQRMTMYNEQQPHPQQPQPQVAILEVAAPSGSTYGQYRDAVLPLTHRYLQYGFVEVPGLTTRLDLFRASHVPDEPISLPTLACPLSRINMSLWTDALVNRNKLPVWQQTFTMADFWTRWYTLPKPLLDALRTCKRTTVTGESNTFNSQSCVEEAVLAWTSHLQLWNNLCTNAKHKHEEQVLATQPHMTRAKASASSAQSAAAAAAVPVQTSVSRRANYKRTHTEALETSLALLASSSKRSRRAL
jgi:hypothetical protein